MNCMFFNIFYENIFGIYRHRVLPLQSSFFIIVLDLRLTKIELGNSREFPSFYFFISLKIAEILLILSDYLHLYIFIT
jgi:hypothetical protein